MTYQVLARKWRPRDFSSLVGQDHVVTALRNGLTEGRIAQAYLFSGIRGVGKTTAARVLAKALNCHEGPSADPCNECPSCLDINGGKSLEVIEIDAATYSKVEQVRELTETLRYGPSDSRYKKVVVLDEVHRLSRQAFDALLKIVEEPPPHLIFIFATTEIDAVPATILSRCQEYQFRRVPSGVLAAHLRTIAEAENIEASDTALRLVARAGEGSVRDSVALLDQMATFGSGKISDEDAAQLLGGLDAAIFQRLLGAVLDGDHGAILEIVRDIELNGWDPNNVYGQFLGFVRDGLHLAMGGATQAVELPAEEADTLRELVRPKGYEAVLQILQLLLSSESMVRRSEFGSLALEVTWLRAAELPKVSRIQDLLSGKASLPDPGQSGPPSTAGGNRSHGSSGSGPSRGPGRHSAEATSYNLGGGEPSPTPPPQDEIRSTAPAPTYTTPPRVSPPREAAIREAAGREAAGREAAGREAAGREAASGGDEAPEAGAREAKKVHEAVDPSRIPSMLEVLGSRRQSLAALCSRAVLDIRDGELVIAPSAGDTFLEGSLQRDRNRKIFEEILEQVWGRAVPWRMAKVGELDDVKASPAPSPRDSGASGNRSSPWPSAAPKPSPTAPYPPSASAPPDPAGHEPPIFWPDHDSSQAGASYVEGEIGNGHGDTPDEGGHGGNVLTPSDPEWARVAELPTVRAVVDLFGGNIQQVRDMR